MTNLIIALSLAFGIFNNDASTYNNYNGQDTYQESTEGESGNEEDPNDPDPNIVITDLLEG